MDYIKEQLEDIRNSLSGGYSVVLKLTTTAQKLSGDGGEILNYNIINTNSNKVYIKLYDSGTDDNLIGSSPLWIIEVFPNSHESNELRLEFTQNLYGIACNGIEDNNNINPSIPVLTQLVCK
jgi:hypothetical protein